MILECSKSYQTIFDTINKAEADLAKELEDELIKKNSAFQSFVVYLLISPYDNEKVDLLNIVQSMYSRELEKNDLLSRFVHKLLTYELMPLNEVEIE